MNGHLCKIYLSDIFYCVLNAYSDISSVNMLKTIFNDSNSVYVRLLCGDAKGGVALDGQRIQL